MPHSPDGVRIDPPVSLPSAAGNRPAARAAPEPLLDPPVKQSVFHGFRAGGQSRSKDGPPWANSCVDSLPIRTPPAANSFAVVVASSSGTRSMQVLEWPEVRIPLVS